MAARSSRWPCAGRAGSPRIRQRNSSSAGHRPRLIIGAGFAGALILRSSETTWFCRTRSSIVKTSTTTWTGRPGLATAVQHSGGRLLTVDQVVLLASKKAELRAAYQADLVDMETAAVAAVCHERMVRFLSVRVISDDAHTDLPREVASVIAHGGSYRIGARAPAVWQRPASVKDFWKLYEHALEAATRLAKFVSLCLDELED